MIDKFQPHRWIFAEKLKSQSQWLIERNATNQTNTDIK